MSEFHSSLKSDLSYSWNSDYAQEPHEASKTLVSDSHRKSRDFRDVACQKLKVFEHCQKFNSTEFLENSCHPSVMGGS